jgi:hypothetical protein
MRQRKADWTAFICPHHMQSWDVISKEALPWSKDSS